MTAPRRATDRCETTTSTWLTFVAGPSEERHLYAVRTAHGAPEGETLRLSSDETASVVDVAWSPRGSYLAYVTKQDDETSLLHVVAMRCGDPEHLASLKGRRPKWSHGDWLAFQDSGALWSLHPEDAPVPRRIDGGIDAGFYTFAPTDDRLVFNTSLGPGIHVVDAAKGWTWPVTTAIDGYGPRWSPTGAALAFGDRERFYWAAPAGPVWMVVPLNAAVKPPAEFASHLFRFSPDGRWLGYQHTTPADVLELFVRDVSGPLPGEPFQPVPVAGQRVSGWWLVPGSDHVVVQQAVDADHPGDLYLVSLDDPGDWRRLNPASVPLENPQVRGFAEGGRSLLYASDRSIDQSFELYRVALHHPGAEAQRISAPLSPGRSVSAAFVAPDGSRLTYVLSSTEPHHAPPRRLVYLDLRMPEPAPSPALDAADWSALGDVAQPFSPDSRAFVYAPADGDVVLQSVDGHVLGPSWIVWEGPAGQLDWLGWQPPP